MAFVPRNLNAIGFAAESFSCPKQLDVAQKDGRVGSRSGVSGLWDWEISADNSLRATDKTSIAQFGQTAIKWCLIAYCTSSALLLALRTSMMRYL